MISPPFFCVIPAAGGERRARRRGIVGNVLPFQKGSGKVLRNGIPASVDIGAGGLVVAPSAQCAHWAPPPPASRKQEVRVNREEVMGCRRRPGACPFSLAASRPGAGGATGGSAASHSYERPASERADGDAEASQVCTKRHRGCHFAGEHLIETRY